MSENDIIIIQPAVSKWETIIDRPIIAEWDKANDHYTHSTAVGLVRLAENGETEKFPDRLIIGDTVYIKEEKK